ncbi:hypothetical protein FIU88_08070 [Halomonas sp. THAF12]|uniref:hypothetical protein n=1 Tax=Halomonas sp. THAF12 TaxID=2587849 RepID=UPI0012691737|nr:hypothetical protein [Halomonas sp. THAF12]QFT84929.1 hypothetical protein FIU88_08070 [Halomonas sp. THAF12]
MSAAIDINSTRQHWPQFHSDQPDTPAEQRIEALTVGEDEAAAEQFVDWLADEDNRETLYHMIVDRLGEDDVKGAARQWAKEAA